MMGCLLRNGTRIMMVVGGGHLTVDSVVCLPDGDGLPDLFEREYSSDWCGVTAAINLLPSYVTWPTCTSCWYFVIDHSTAVNSNSIIVNDAPFTTKEGCRSAGSSTYLGSTPP